MCDNEIMQVYVRKKRPHLGGENVRVRGIVDVAARDQIVAGAKDAQLARRGGADHGRHEEAVLGAVDLCARGGGVWGLKTDGGQRDNLFE